MIKLEMRNDNDTFSVGLGRVSCSAVLLTHKEWRMYRCAPEKIKQGLLCLVVNYAVGSPVLDSVNSVSTVSCRLRSRPGILGSNLAEKMDVFLVCLLCVVQLATATDLIARSVECCRACVCLLCMIMKPHVSRPKPDLGCCDTHTHKFYILWF